MKVLGGDIPSLDVCAHTHMRDSVSVYLIVSKKVCLCERACA